jgi:hypothetical protein
MNKTIAIQKQMRNQARWRRRARLVVIAVLAGATALAVGVLTARAGEREIPDNAWANTPECQALKRSTRGSNIPIPDNCEVGMADEPPRAVRWQPRQEVWQCNDIRVTWTNTAPGVINYDIGGTVWGGINFTYTPRGLFLRGVPCVPLR